VIGRKNINVEKFTKTLGKNGTNNGKISYPVSGKFFLFQNGSRPVQIENPSPNIIFYSRLNI
jgi:hypothetical protein